MDEIRKLRDDFRGATLFRILAQPGYWGVLNFRIAAALVRLPGPPVLYYLYAPVWRLMTLVTGIEISPRATIGGGLRVVHFGQVFINSGSVIGKRCLILNDVTIGISTFEGNDSPILGDDINIGVGVRILGPITVGSGSRIGANAVVTKTFEGAQLLVGLPARAVKALEYEAS
jgi:serine O-acetyltransferase